MHFKVTLVIRTSRKPVDGEGMARVAHYHDNTRLSRVFVMAGIPWICGYVGLKL